MPSTPREQWYRWTDSEIERAMYLRGLGWSYEKISEGIGTTKNAVINKLNRIRDTGRIRHHQADRTPKRKRQQIRDHDFYGDCSDMPYLELQAMHRDMCFDHEDDIAREHGLGRHWHDYLVNPRSDLKVVR